jgi:hypothetical protein
MKNDKFDLSLIFFMILLSVVLYFAHFMIFRDPHHIFIYMVGDLAFFPIEVLLFTLIIHRMLEFREKRALMLKLNMVIGTFFGEVGMELLKALTDVDKNIETIRDKVLSAHDWSDKEVARVNTVLRRYIPDVDSRDCNLESLKGFLSDRRDFMLRLLENPNLLEHETFTDLLWSVSHLQEELLSREGFDDLPDSDLDHLSIDINRAYVNVIKEWVSYMKHLKDRYPYLFSLSLRKNPFDMNASVIVR